MKKFKPTSPGIRHKVTLKNKGMGPQVVPKDLRVSIPKTGGRNNTGHISAFHRGGGSFSFTRLVTCDPKWEHATIVAIHSDPHRSAPLAQRSVLPMASEEEIELEAHRVDLVMNEEKLVHRIDHNDPQTVIDAIGARTHVLLTDVRLMQLKEDRKRWETTEYVVCGKGMVPGMVIHSGPNAPFSENCRLPRSKIPMGTHVFDLEITPGKGSQRVKTAGAHAERVFWDEAHHRVLVRLPSKEQRWVLDSCMACIGHVANEDHQLKVAGKAGVTRHRGIRPTVRGTAMNPIDHPHGGRTAGGRPEVTPWSKIAKGKPTRSRRRHSVYILKSPAGSSKH
jgi:ribosomal protein L2